MKSPQINISFPPTLHGDLAHVASARGVSVAALVRDIVAAEISRITGRNYGAIHWGGGRRGAGRKPAQSDAFRAAVSADADEAASGAA